MLSNGDGVFDKLSLDELIELLVNKTEEYIELMKQKNANAIELGNLKLELDILHTVINQKKVAH
jgi:hypothetical protein